MKAQKVKIELKRVTGSRIFIPFSAIIWFRQFNIIYLNREASKIGSN